MLGHPSVQLGLPQGDGRLGGYPPPSSPTLSSWEGEAALPATVGERARTQHADHLGVLQHGSPAGSLYRHPHVPRGPKPRRHRVLQGQAGLRAQEGSGPGRRAGPMGAC